MAQRRNDTPAAIQVNFKWIGTSHQQFNQLDLNNHITGCSEWPIGLEGVKDLKCQRADNKIYVHKILRAVSSKLYLIENSEKGGQTSVDLEKAAHYVPPHLGIPCLKV